MSAPCLCVRNLAPVLAAVYPCPLAGLCLYCRVFGVICRGVVQSLARDIIALYTPVLWIQNLIHRRRNLAPVLAVPVCLACPSCGVLYRYTGAAVTIYGGGRITPDRPPRRCRCLCRTDGRTLLVTPAVFLSFSVISVLRRYSPALAGRAGYLWRLTRPRQYWRPSLSVVCPCPLRGCLSCRLSMNNLQPCGVSRPACGLNTASRATTPRVTSCYIPQVWQVLRRPWSF